METRKSADKKIVAGLAAMVMTTSALSNAGGVNALDRTVDNLNYKFDYVTNAIVMSQRNEIMTFDVYDRNNDAIELNVEITEYSDGRTEYRARTTKDTDLVPGNAYSIRMIPKDIDSKVCVIPTEFDSQHENVKAITQIKYDDLLYSLYLAVENTDELPTISADTEILAWEVTNSAAIPYKSSLDLLTRADTDLNGFIDAADASTILGIYAASSVSTNINTMADYYRYQKFMPEDSTLTQYGRYLEHTGKIPQFLNKEMYSFTSSDELTARVFSVDNAGHAELSKEYIGNLKSNIKIYANGSFDLTVYNGLGSNTSIDLTNQGSNFSRLALNELMVIPDGYRASIASLIDGVNVQLYDKTVLSWDTNIKIGVKLDNGLDYIHSSGHYLRPLVVYSGAEEIKIEPNRPIFTIHCEPTEELCKQDSYEVVLNVLNKNLRSLIGLDGTVEIVEASKISPDDNRKVINGLLLNPGNVMYDPEADSIKRLDINMDGSTDASDASDALSVYAINSTTGDLKTVGEYKEWRESH